MNIFSRMLAYIKGELAELEAAATELEHKILPGIEAAAHQAIKVFGEKALPIIQQLGEALIAGLASGGNASVLIPELVNEAVKDLEPALIDAGKNVLYTTANLTLAEVLSGTAPAPKVEGVAAAEGSK